jgi:SAM-dependent MidA family methyltransferase
MSSNPILCEKIKNHLANSPQQRITFAKYMDMVLYHPQDGYYSTQAVNLGKKGDFFTSVHLGADFGEMLATQFVDMWESLGKPPKFSLVEMGAGQGYLAADILNFLQKNSGDFFQVVEYIIVEKSPILQKQQQQKLEGFDVNWCDLEEIVDDSIVGCFFSNELVDAFPVHQFIVNQGKIAEIFVTHESLLPVEPPEKTSNNWENSFVEVTGEISTSQLVSYFELIDINIHTYSDEYRSEVNLAALDCLTTVSAKLQKGYLLTIDYGYSATRYYNPRRNQGNLQCYYQHQRHDNPYINIGKQDITTHVDFTALELWGEKCGLKKVGFTQQALFLMALGLGTRIAQISDSKLPLNELLQRRDRLQQLLDPMGLGSFGVLIQSKKLSDVESTRSLKGLIIPE